MGKVEVPKGWEETTLGNCCDLKIGGTPSRKNIEYWDTSKITKNL